MPRLIDPCDLHDRALAQWFRERPDDVPAGADLESLVLAQHFCNFSLWHLENEARRVDVDDSFIAGIKRAIDQANQRRNDQVEQLDEALLAQLPNADSSTAEQHSETPGQMIDRLSILSLKIWCMSLNASREDAPAVAAECTRKLAILNTQREDLAQCFEHLLDECRAGRRFFKVYRQFKAYNDPQLNPALRRQ